MARIELPNEPGDFNVDGVSIVILPKKIIVDTGGRSNATRVARDVRSAYADKKSGNGGGKKKGDSAINSILDSCQEFVMPGSTKGRR